MTDTLDGVSHPIRFISETAAGADFFEGSHQRVADAMALTVSDSGAKTIGLVGRWGSGKSTVIKLVSDALSGAKDVKYHVFTYDAWIHQSDPPRRAFLEQLISFLSGRGLGDAQSWAGELAELQRLKDETTSTTTPVLTAAGKALLLPLFLLPIGFIFASRPWYDAWKAANSRGWDFWPFTLAIVIVAAPVVVLGWLYLKLRKRLWPFSRQFWTRANWITHKHPHEEESLLALIANKHVVRQHSASLKAVEPTAIEFQKMFRRILQSVKTEQDRLVIVIDNLDRLDRDEAIAMWTTIRSFFLGAIPAGEQLDRSDLPTVILPIDESAMKRARKEDSDNGFDRSFMDKSFDVIFHVAPPILSNWQAYLNKQLEECFGTQLQANWRYQVGRIYRQKADSGETVTPRDINKTVNSIAALWLQSRSLKIPFSSVAYYAINKQVIDKDLAKALNHPALDISDEDPEWQRSIAALHYGTAPEHALQILLDMPLRQAIEQNSPVAFVGWASVSGFEQAIQKIIDEAGFLSPNRLTNFILLLAKLPNTQDFWLGLAWRQLAKLFAATELWSNTGNSAPQCVDIILERLDAQRRAKFITALVSRISELPQANFVGPEFLSLAPAILKSIASAAKAEKVSLPKLTLAADDEQFLELAAQIQGHDEALDLITANRDTKDLVSLLAHQLQNPASHKRLKAKARIVLDTEPSEWKDLVEAASAAIQAGDAASSGSAAAVLVLGSLFAVSREADDAAVANAGNGHLQAIINANWTGSMDVVVNAITLLILVGASIGPPPGGDWANAVASVPELPDAVGRQLIEWREQEFFPLLSNQTEHDPSIIALTGPIMSACIKRRDLGVLPVKEILTEPDKFVGQLDQDDRAAFIDLLPAQKGFWEALASAGLGTGAVQITTRLLSSRNAAPSDRATARKGLSDKLKAVTLDSWVAAVRDGDTTFEAAAALQETTARSIALEQPLFAALTQLMPELIADQQRPYARRWFQAAGFLAASHKRTLLRNLRDQLLTVSTPVRLNELLAVGREDFLRDGDFIAKADEIARKLIVPMVEGGGLAWLVDQRSTVSAWMKKARPESREYVRSNITNLLDDLDQEDRVRAELLLAGIEQ